MPEDPLIGQQLGNFGIERLIGRGGMASVYYGWDVKLERPVAIKLIDARYRDSPSYAARFVREARAVATWRHEHVVQIYHADEQDGLYYFAMEYIDGLDLGKLLSDYALEGESVSYDDVLLVGRAIASALDYAHQQGVIHRDVKPSNVIVSREGRIVLTDFGLALDAQIGTLGQVFGSPHYIAPEQARSSADVIPQSDLYALGVILYEMLTGQVPFDDPSSTSVALKHLTEAPPPPRELNPNLSLETEAVLLKALSKSPQGRYATGAELLDSLEKSLRLPAGVPHPLEQPAERTVSKISIHERMSSQPKSGDQPALALDSPPRTDASLVGVRLDEYRLEALLGKGGMAGIYRGLDVHLKRFVAIKVIDSPFRTDSEYVLRFEREAQAIAQLEHPHIVHLYRYGEADGLLYMAMQYVDGADLGSVLDSFKADHEFIEPQDAGRIVRELCAALDYAHQRGVIHRDVKPENVMLDKQGRAYLTDFGLALLTEAGTRGEIFGSPHYMAPEQAVSSANVVPQSDLYAVGVTLYEMFTNKLPFDAESPLDIAMLHLSEQPRPPRELNPAITPELETVILRALARGPQERYQSGAELADALEQALAPAPSADSRLTVPQRVALEMNEHPLPAIPETIIVPPPPSAGAQPIPAPAAPSLPWLKIGLALTGLSLIGCLFLSTILLIAKPWQSSEKAASLESTSTAQVTAPQPTPTAAGVATLPSPTASAPPAATPTPVESHYRITAETTTPEASGNYTLLIVAQGEDSLFVVNRAAEPFPLGLLRLGDGEIAVDGANWGIALLESDACVALWKEKDQPKSPDDLDCEPEGERLTREGKGIFWKENFDVYLNGELAGACNKKPKDCLIGSLDDQGEDSND